MTQKARWLFRRHDSFQESEVALVHDYVTQRGGAERVALEFCRIFQSAILHTSVFNSETSFPGFAPERVRPSRLSRIGLFRRSPELLFPVLPLIFGSRRLSARLVIASSSGWAHGVRVRGALVVYCHNPARWLYQTNDYFLDLPRWLRYLLRFLLIPFRVWDRNIARRASLYIANSTSVADRIRATYGIEPHIIFPPPGLKPDGRQVKTAGLEDSFFLTVSRRRSYKNTEVVCEAAAAAGVTLVVVGGLPAREGGWPAHILGLIGVSDDQLRWLYANCKAVVAVGREDFGLTPVEGFSLGAPCIALRAGGYLDSCVEGVTGVFVDYATVPCLLAALKSFDPSLYSRDLLIAHSEQFNSEAFRQKILDVVGQF